ncbi:MAG TPA: 3'(2'),5'-bisphosphate nucleotidase CysQ [Chitinophagaceae bacterium]|jgi:3'(2'), 5'-bisphosphate nucleotidase
MHNFINVAIEAAIEAGKKILEVYQRDFTVETKTDNSPLTEADQQAHHTIKDILQQTGFPILSEEGKQMPYQERKQWDKFWLVDPLDGTKEFIKKNGEFTVNIALIKNGTPVMGVVYVPVTGVVYAAAEETGSFSFNTNNNGKAISEMINDGIRLPLATKPEKYTIVASRSHSSPETETFIEERKKVYGDVNLISAGSSLKLCLVAEGRAQVYPRLAPTMEWDTAAGHAVAKFAGCKVYNYQSNDELKYNKENLLNPWFVVERR